jgi:hypothetical protein
MSRSKGVQKAMKQDGTTKYLSGEYDILKYVRDEYPEMFIPTERIGVGEPSFLNIMNKILPQEQSESDS